MGGIASDRAPEGTAADVVELLWAALADLLGAPTTATLLRRAAKYAAGRHPELQGFSVVREGFEYRYVLPPAWSQAGQGHAALGALVRHLIALLEELTGSVVIIRLRALPELAGYDLLRSERDS